jgi:thiamine-phosphate pyrophosphorylase
MRDIYRILDANLNRAREGLRVIEDCGRFVLNDPGISAIAKHFRSDLRELVCLLPVEEMILARDISGDVGGALSSATESKRADLEDVVRAACKRLTESLRTIEEYCKIVAPARAITIERMRYDAYTLEQRVNERFMVAGRFSSVGLYALLSTKYCRGLSLYDIARQAIAGGATAIQLREKECSDVVYLAMAAELRKLTEETGTLLIINDRPDIAAMVSADGVHLGQDDLPIRETRRLLPPAAIIGRSCHSLNDVKAAINEGADYIALGPMFSTATKDRNPVGPVLLSETLTAFPTPPVPIVVIGGIDESNAASLIEAGASCLAVCGAINQADNPKLATESICALIQKP